MNYKGYFFDFDYTLADSGDAIAMCFQMLFKAHGIGPVTDEQIKATIGYSWAQGTTMLTGITDSATLEQYRQEYVGYADRYMTANTRLFPGVGEWLARLKKEGAVLYIVSNKAGSRIMETVKMHDLEIDGIIGGEDVLEPKPAPEGLLKAVERSGLEKSRCVYVGDSHIDALAAQNAGMDFIGVTTGSTLRKELEKYPHVKIVESIACLDEKAPEEYYGELIARAQEAMKKAYCPYSGFRVGAAILDGDHRIHTGCNVENASYGATICAERGAVMKGVSEGMTAIKAVAIVSSSGDRTYPCGVCRQVLAEFMTPEGAMIFSAGSGIEEEPFWQLLPKAFTKSSIREMRHY